MGLDLDLFNKTLEGLTRAHRYFEDFFPPNKMEGFQPVFIHRSIGLASHTRYLTSWHNCHSAEQQPFGPGVDPNRDLESLKGNTYVHTEDNIVQYLGQKDIENGLMYV